MYSILQTAKLNGVNPEAYLARTLSQDSRRGSDQPRLRTDALGLPVRGPAQPRLITANIGRLPKN